MRFRLNNSLRKSSGNNQATDRDQADSDSDDFMVKVNKFQEDEVDMSRRGINSGPNRMVIGDDDEQEDDQHGALVKKILESKEQLELGNDPNRNREVDLKITFPKITDLF